MSKTPELIAQDAQGSILPRRYVLTWHLGYAAALDLAESLSSGTEAVLVTLVTQELPEDDEIERIRCRGFPMIVVPDRFESEQNGQNPSSDLSSALETALSEYHEGFGWPPAPPVHNVDQECSTPSSPPEDDSDRQKADFLRAMYGDGRDDGTR